MKEKVLFAACFLAFIGIMDYPFLARIYNERVQGSVVSGYQYREAQLVQDDKTEILKSATDYNKHLAAQNPCTLADAFVDTLEQDALYESLLNIESDGIMAVIEISKIQVTLPVYHGTSEKVLQKGAGHLEGSSLPIGGENTHTCISAHRGLPNKKMFTNLDLLEKGDTFYIKVLDKTFAYEVYSVETVTPDQTETLNIRQGEDLATLITCTPYGINTHRLYVHGSRIPLEEAVVKEERGQTVIKLLKLYWWIPMTVILLMWMGIMLHWMNGKK